jgi:Putative zinc-finger
MSCENVQKLISPLLDRRVTGQERESVLAHLGSCAVCAGRLKAMENLRSDLLRLTAPPIPAHLAQKLRVMASHERLRRVRRATWAKWLEYWQGRLELSFNNLMRPMALPFVGGLISALVVFSFVFVPAFGMVRTLGFDPAIELVTLPDGRVQGPKPEETQGVILRGPALPCDDTIVELTIDENGNVRDWTMIRGKMTQDVKNMIVYSQFTPATYFGRPVQGKVQVALHSVDHDART